MLSVSNLLNSKPEFESFAYTDYFFQKTKQSASTRIKTIAQTTIAASMIPLAVAIDLMTVSFRVIKHINAINSYKAEGFHLKEFLSQSYEEIAFQFGLIDLKELEYSPVPLTNRLIEKIEKFPISSKVMKSAFRLVAGITVQFTVVLDVVGSPFRYYKHLYYRYPDLIKHIKSKRVKYRRLALFVLVLGAGTAFFKTLNSTKKPSINSLSLFSTEVQDGNYFSEKTLMTGGMLALIAVTAFSSIILKLRDDQYREANRQSAQDRGRYREANRQLAQVREVLAERTRINQELRENILQKSLLIEFLETQLNVDGQQLSGTNNEALRIELVKVKQSLAQVTRELQVERGEVEIPEYLQTMVEICTCFDSFKEEPSGKGPIVSHIATQGKFKGWVCKNMPMHLSCYQSWLKNGPKKCPCGETIKSEDLVEVVEVPSRRIEEREIPRYYSFRPLGQVEGSPAAAAPAAPAAIP